MKKNSHLESHILKGILLLREGKELHNPLNYFQTIGEVLVKVLPLDQPLRNNYKRLMKSSLYGDRFQTETRNGE